LPRVLRPDRLAGQGGPFALLQHVRRGLEAPRPLSRQSRRVLSLVFSEARLRADAGSPLRSAFSRLLGMRTELASRDRVLRTTSSGARGVPGLPAPDPAHRTRRATPRDIRAHSVDRRASSRRSHRAARSLDRRRRGRAPVDTARAQGLFDAREPRGCRSRARTRRANRGAEPCADSIGGSAACRTRARLGEADGGIEPGETCPAE